MNERTETKEAKKKKEEDEKEEEEVQGKCVKFAEYIFAIEQTENLLWS